MSEATLPLEQKRLQELFERCQQEVISQVIGPFGLSTAMFADKDGGNVTTTNNFEKGVTATELDQQRHEQWKKNCESPIDRTAFDKVLPAKRKEMFKNNEPIISAHTGNELARDGSTHLDHTRSVNSIEKDPRANLFMSQDQRVEMANDPKNLVPTESSINQSMQDKDKLEWANQQRKKDPGKTNAESFGVDMERLIDTKEAADKHIDSSVLSAQVKKQGTELLTTGASQAAMMGVRQALGMLLTELVNQLFNEIKDLYKQGVASGKALLQELKLRAKKIIDALVKKLPDTLNQIFEGGLSGFASNLITFLINTFITTAKNVVRIIREGLISLFKAIKMVLFPKKGVDKQESLKAALKLLTTAVLTSLGILFEEALKGFLVAIPVIGVFADIISPVLMGILVGITSALLAYGIDRLFDKYCGPTFDEKILNQLIENTSLHSKFADDLVDQLDVSMMTVENYQYSIRINQEIAEKFAGALASNDYTLYLLEHDIVSTEMQVRSTNDEIKREESFIADLEIFLMNQEKGV